MLKIAFGGAAAAMLLLHAGAASAHITLETPEAHVGASYKAVLQINHGCDGSATTRIRVRIPEGVINVKPQPKPGWTVDLVRGAYAKPYTLWGTSVTQGVKEIVWSGGSLPDDFYDELVFRAYLTPGLEGDMLYFPVVQECEKGVERWIDIPEAGKSSEDYETPAPGLKLIRAK